MRVSEIPALQQQEVKVPFQADAESPGPVCGAHSAEPHWELPATFVIIVSLTEMF